MKLCTELYISQVVRWPEEGHVILAQFDAETVVVYQAYHPSIGYFAAANKRFGGEFRVNRMSWIKPGFLWMMHRSGWGTKQNQEVILAIWLKRSAFEKILEVAVPSTYDVHLYQSEADWKLAVVESSVRLQWDPDHHPSGKKLKRRVIQLGLRGQVLQQYMRNWIIDIEDISKFVQDQRRHIVSHRYEELIMPNETIYTVEDPTIANRLCLSC